jgi:hypothetical protein
MADQIVSWGGFNSKSTAGMGVTGSFQVSSSANSFFVGGGNVGIGTPTPSASLHISGSSGSVLFEIDSNSQQNILYVSGSGNVGIGTGSPSTLLNLKQVNSSTSILRLDSSTSVGSNTYEVGVDFYSRITGAGGTDSYPVGKIYGTGGSEFRSGKLRFQTIITNGGSLTDTITLYQGNVGIGSLNTTPSTLLQVTGLKDTVVADFSSNTVGLNEGVSIQLSAAASSYPLGVIKGIFTNYGGYSDLTFSTSTLNTPTEAMRINSSQQVGIGTTSPTAKLHVKGSGTTSSTTALLVQNANASASLQVRDDGTTTIASNTNRGYNLDVNGTGIINDCYFGDSLGPRIRASGGSGIISCVYNSLTLSSGANVGVSNNTFTVGPGSDTNGQLTVTTPAKVANTSETVNISAGNMYYGGGEGRFVIQAQGNASSYNALGNMYIAGGRNTNGGAHGNVYLGVDLTSPLGNVSVGTTSSLNYKFNVSGSGNFTNNLTVTGSLTVSSILTLTPQDPLPSGVPTGSFAVSSSSPPKPYFYDGTTWNALY